jgi:hypothetical protein
MGSLFKLSKLLRIFTLLVRIMDIGRLGGQASNLDPRCFYVHKKISEGLGMCVPSSAPLFVLGSRKNPRLFGCQLSVRM